ncbi:peroxiredoxin [Bacteroidota bacterium]
MKTKIMKFSIFSLLLSFFITTDIFSESNTLEVGAKVPDFKAKSDELKTWKSKDYIGKKNLIVYFYPAAFTGGCTKQACSYRDDLEEIENKDAIVVGVSGDKPENLKLFKEHYNLNFTLLSDETGEIARIFGVPVKEGKTISKEVDGKELSLTRGATISRWTFIIDKEGKVIHKSTQVNAANDSKAVIKVLSGM